MASGYGYNGGPSRCFRHWQDFQKCYSSANSPYECVAQKDDYLECLHHTKEIERATMIRDTFLARKAHEARQNREKGELRTTSSVLRLGIIGQEGNGGEDSSNSSSSSSPPPAQNKGQGADDTKGEDKS